jgi:hypothetical protein
VCTHAPTSGGRRSSASTASPTSTRCIPASNEKVQLCAFDVLALDGDDYLDAPPCLRPLPDRVGRTRSAANGERALLPKLLIFFCYGQADAEKRSRAYLEPNLGFIRMAMGVRLGNHARLHGDERRPSNAVQLCATVHPDCRLQTRSSVTLQ